MSTTDEPTCEHGETESHWMHCGLLNHEESDDHTCEFSWCGGPFGPTRPKAWQKRDIDVSGYPREDAPHLSWASLHLVRVRARLAYRYRTNTGGSPDLLAAVDRLLADLEGEPMSARYTGRMEAKHLIEEIVNVVANGPLWPGDAISHAGARECERLGWSERDHDGNIVATRIGRAVAWCARKVPKDGLVTQDPSQIAACEALVTMGAIRRAKQDNPNLETRVFVGLLANLEGDR